MFPFWLPSSGRDSRSNSYLCANLQPSNKSSHPVSRDLCFQLFPPTCTMQCLHWFLSPSSLSLNTEKSPVTINKFTSKSCVHFHTLFIHGSSCTAATKHFSVPNTLLLCPSLRRSMYHSATGSYLTLLPPPPKKQSKIFADNTFLLQPSVSLACLNYKFSSPGTCIYEVYVAGVSPFARFSTLLVENY